MNTIPKIKSFFEYIQIILYVIYYLFKYIVKKTIKKVNNYIQKKLNHLINIIVTIAFYIYNIFKFIVKYIKNSTYNHLFVLFTEILITIVFIFIVYASYKTHNIPILKNFHAPLEIEKQGYKPDTIIWEIVDQMSMIRGKLTTLAAKARTIQVNENISSLERLDVINIESIGGPMIHTAQEIVKFILLKVLKLQQPIISGYITKDKELSITIRMTGRKTQKIRSPNKNLQELFHLAALYILKNIEPLSLGVDYYIREKKDELNALAAYTAMYAKSNKEKSDHYILEALSFDLQRDYRTALEKIFIAIFYQSDEPIANHFCGDLLTRLEKYDSAIDQYYKALDCDKSMIEIYTKLANVYARQEKYDNAIKMYETAVTKDPLNSNIYRNWGLDLMNYFSQKENALKKFKEAVRLSPNNPEHYIYWGNALKHYKDYDLALSKYKKALTLKPNNEATASVYIAWGEILTQQRKDEEAFEKFSKAESYAPISEVYYTWANALKEFGNYADALKKYERAIEIDPKNYYAYIDFGNALIEMERYTVAISMFKQAISIEPKLEWAYAFWGYALVQLNKNQEAIEKCKKAIEINSNFSFAYTFWGDALLHQKKYDQAIEMEKKSIHLNPNCYLAYTIWGEILLEKSQPEAAIKKFKKSLSIDPITVENYYNYGKALYQLGRYTEALEKFQNVTTKFHHNQYKEQSIKMINLINQKMGK